LKISENSSKIHELFWNLWQFLNNSKIHEKFSRFYHNSKNYGKFSKIYGQFVGNCWFISWPPGRTRHNALITRQNPISKYRCSSSILILSLYILCIRNNKCFLLTERGKIRKKHFILHNFLHDIIVIFLSLMKKR
jgi:hypothetical protein